MHLVAVPVFALAMVSLLMALINLLVFVRRRSLRLHLYLALSCLGIAVYDMMCVGLYQATDLATGAAWQRAQIVTLALASPMVIRFVALYTRFDWPWVTRIVSVAAVTLAVVSAVERHGLLLTPEPAIKHVTLPMFGPVTYYESATGPVFLIFLIIVAVELVFFLRAGIAFLRTGRRLQAVSFMASVAIFFTSIISDALVSAGVHVAPYVTEYGFTAMTIITGILLTDEFLRTAVLEDALQQSRRLEALGRLAGGVAHDLNNYLTPIMGFTDFVMDRFEPGSQEHEDLRRVQTGTMRASALTQQLLAFGRRQVLAPATTTIDAVIDDLKPLMLRLLGDAVELELALDTADAAVRVDVGQIEQMVLNLATNARDAMPEGGRLRLASVSLPDAVVITVGDNGCGMPDEMVKRAFDPFYTTKAPGEGTGLGLAQVHGIVEQHAGSISITSAVGEGTSVRIRLPRTRVNIPVDHGSLPAVTGAGEQPGGGERVLVVDDEEDIRRLLRRTLEANGYRVATAAGLAAASDLAHDEGPFDLLLTDMLLLDGNGLEVVAAVTRHAPEVAVLLMSGFDEDLLGECHGAAAEHPLLRKPIAPTSLLEYVRTALDDTTGARV